MFSGGLAVQVLLLKGPRCFCNFQPASVLLSQISSSQSYILIALLGLKGCCDQHHTAIFHCTETQFSFVQPSSGIPTSYFKCSLNSHKHQQKVLTGTEYLIHVTVMPAPGPGPTMAHGINSAPRRFTGEQQGCISNPASLQVLS